MIHSFDFLKIPRAITESVVDTNELSSEETFILMKIHGKHPYEAACQNNDTSPPLLKVKQDYDIGLCLGKF